ncbi:MAG TPA: carboxypeptidase-like regulatory domain-containing protein, partial [Cytophagaceae bacterium]|nr:carboxypeptidase-like regulatory domain-containing protein [Cytophagaceae bacterium]
EEPKPVVPAPVVKKEEPKPVTPAPVAAVKKEEPKPVVPAPVVKKEEPKPTTPAPVIPAPVAVVKKEEPKPATTSTEEEDPFASVFESDDKAALSAIKGNVMKKSNSENLNGAKLILKANGRKIDSITTVVNGGFMFSKLKPGTNYELYVSRKGYFDQKVTVNSSVLQPGQTGTVKVQLDADPNFKDTGESGLVFVLKGKVTNDSNNPQAGITVTLTNNIDKTSVEVKADQKGEYSFNLKKQCHYTVKAERGSCKSLPINKSTIGLQASQTFEQNLVIKCGE